MSQHNQFTKAEEQGLPKPKSTNAYMKGTRDRMDPRQKAAIRASQLSNRLHKFAMAKGEKVKKHYMDQAQVSAAKVLIDKGMPSLQAIEQTEVNQFEKMSEDELLDLVNALITSNPGLIERLGIRPQLVSDQTPNTPESCTKAA
jgi:hypothetical protein